MYMILYLMRIGFCKLFIVLLNEIIEINEIKEINEIIGIVFSELTDSLTNNC